MPAYVSHTIMAREVYRKLNDKNVNLDYMITHSLGGDLCKYSKCRKDSHRIKKDEFIYNLKDYMINNNLERDSECLGVLYGHICHYIMDDIIHPLVRKIDKTCIKNKKNHTMIELYYDNYFSRKKCNQRLDKYDNKLLFNGKMNKKISNMIDYAYKKTYNTDNVSRYYKFNIWLYKKIRILYKLFNFKLLKKFSGINKFLENNSNIDLLNHNNKITYKLNDNNCTLDLDSLYDMSVNLAIEKIKQVK